MIDGETVERLVACRPVGVHRADEERAGDVEREREDLIDVVVRDLGHGEHRRVGVAAGRVLEAELVAVRARGAMRVDVEGVGLARQHLELPDMLGVAVAVCRLAAGELLPERLGRIVLRLGRDEAARDGPGRGGEVGRRQIDVVGRRRGFGTRAALVAGGVHRRHHVVVGGSRGDPGVQIRGAGDLAADLRVPSALGGRAVHAVAGEIAFRTVGPVERDLFRAAGCRQADRRSRRGDVEHGNRDGARDALVTDGVDRPGLEAVRPRDRGRRVPVDAEGL